MDDELWARIRPLLPPDLRAADRLDLSRAAIDSSHIRAMGGGASGEHVFAQGFSEPAGRADSERSRG
ncbi:hypothetical protein [Streptomyces goshikiensis]|uniref:hypothetical protein n=1 Tax=Streptomyces goshikiensis TaxID=1942 RepID=UPI003646AE30